MLRTTWADKALATRQVLRRTVWEEVLFTDPERGVAMAHQFPTVDGHMDFLAQVYSPLAPGPIHPDDVDLPAGLQRVAVGVRPLIIEWRWLRWLPTGKQDETGKGSLPVSQWAWDVWLSFGGATAMFMETFADTPVSFQLRYRGGPATYVLGNRIGKAWER